MRQHQLKSLQEGEMTPFEKNRRNGCRVKTWNMIQVRCICSMLTVWERVSCMTGLLFTSERLTSMLPRFIVTVCSEQLGRPLTVRGDCLRRVDGPRGDQLFCRRQSGGTAFGGTTYSTTIPDPNAAWMFFSIVRTASNVHTG